MTDESAQDPNAASLQPKVEELSLDAKLTGGIEGLKSRFLQLPLYTITSSPQEINLVKVESRNISKKPYLFHIMTLTPAKLAVTYSYLPDSSLSLRRATILKNLSSVLSLVSDVYTVDTTKFLQYTDSMLDSLISGLSQNYTSLYNKYDAMLNDYRDLKRLNIELAASNRNLTIQSTQLSDDNKIMHQQLDELKKFSDESLMALVEEWIQVHNSSIDLVEFAKAHDMSPTRVEQILDKMVSLGYIESRS